MDLMQPIDQYCERLDASFFSEPLNLFSNLAFLLAAWVAFRKLQTKPHYPHRRTFMVAIILATTIGIGSGMFHSLAVGWAMLADVIPIGLFIFYFVWFACRKVLNFSTLGVTRAFIGLAGLTFFFIAVVPPALVNNSQPYFGTLAFLLGLGIYSWRRQPKLARALIIAGVMMGVSLVCRAIDMQVCPTLPIGTHFIWHSINGFVIACVLLGALAADPA